MKAFVAGGTGGLGAPICRSLAAKGHAVAIGYHLHSARAADLARRLLEDMRGCAFGIDVTQATQVESAIHEAAAMLGGIDIVVNAAAANVDGLLSNLSSQDVTRVHAVNVLGSMNVARAAFPHFLRAGGGCVINFSSVLAARSMTGVSAYASTKGAIEAMTRALAVEWGPKGIRVNAVAPGFIDAGLGRQPVLAAGGALRHWVPLGRAGLAEEVASVVAFLVSNEARYVNGSIIPVDGGLLAGAPGAIGRWISPREGAQVR
jgi:NAD(P)-dependent dehydrogenase (short-subunit alcohol dehydrogenase family)